MPVRIAVPNKGRLTEDALDLLRRIGLRAHAPSDRALVLQVPGGAYQILYSRAQDIPEFVETGAADVGITGLDRVEEAGCDVERLLDLPFGRCRLVAAAPEGGPITAIDETPARARVATSYPRLTRAYFERRGRKGVRIVPLSGATEIAPSIGVAELITDVMETGATLRQNHLVLLDVILDSHAVVIANRGARKAKAGLIETLAAAFRSVVEAERRRYLMANVRRKDVARITKLLPGLSSPTVMDLASSGMVAVHAVVDEDHINELVPRLRKAGATGILVLPIERLVP